MKAFSSLHNKGKTQEDLLKEQIFSSMCGFDFFSTTCDIFIKMRKPEGGCRPGIR